MGAALQSHPGKAYTVKGHVGLQLLLLDGKKIHLGARQQAAFIVALDKMKKQ